MTVILVVIFFSFMVFRSSKIISFLFEQSDVAEGNSKVKMDRNFSADCLLFFFAWFLVFLDFMLFSVSVVGGNQSSGILIMVILVSLFIILFQFFFNLMPGDYLRLYLKLFFWIIGIVTYASLFNTLFDISSIMLFLILLTFFIYLAHRIYKKVNIDLNN